MSTPFIWGNAPRATNDNTLIDEAIAEAIGSHEADPEAHLGADESLQSHRAAEIIDHRAESVVNDKIARTARRFVAIVDPNSASDFASIQGALDYAVGIGGGDIFVVPGTHTITADINMSVACGIYGAGAGESRIIPSGGVARQLRILGVTNITPSPMTGWSFTKGSATATYNYTEWELYDELIGLPVFDDSGNTAQGILAGYNNTTGVATLETGAVRTNASATVNIDSGAVLTNGSNECEIITESNVWKYGFMLGAYMNLTYNNTDYEIIKKDVGNKILTATVYGGATGIYRVMAKAPGTYTASIEGLQLGNATADLRVGGNKLGNRTLITDCTIWERVPGEATYGETYIDKCKIYKGGSIYRYGYEQLYVSNSSVVAMSANTRPFYVTSNCEMRNVAYTRNGGTFSEIIDHVGANLNIRDSYLLLDSTQNLASSAATGTANGKSFINNDLQLGASGVLSFNYRRWIVRGNRFTKTGSAGVNLNANSNRCIFVENITNGAVTNSGTDNIVANNASAY